MRNYWIIAGDPFYSKELGRHLNSIQLVEDEDTDEKFRASHLILTHGLPSGYLTPGDFWERFTQKGGRYASIEELEVFDNSGNHTATVKISQKFGLFASWECMMGNGWIG